MAEPTADCQPGLVWRLMWEILYARSNFTHLHRKTHFPTHTDIHPGVGKVSWHSGSERSCRSANKKREKQEKKEASRRVQCENYISL